MIHIYHYLVYPHNEDDDPKTFLYIFLLFNALVANEKLRNFLPCCFKKKENTVDGGEFTFSFLVAGLKATQEKREEKFVL